jgi:hypothetical protein
MQMNFKLLIAFTFLSIQGNSQNIDSLLSALYFNNGIGILDSSGFNYTENYSPSGSYWGIDSFPESVVFHCQLSYDNPLDTLTSYSIRVGKGGHLYSFRSSFGESVPPQLHHPSWAQPTYGGGTSYAPWVDEVWQMVCVDGDLNSPPDSLYFIHQSGVYLKTPSQTQPFYSPMLAEYFNPNEQSYSVVNWGQQAHTDALQNINYTSGLLYYTKYSNKGKGIIQVDNMIYNFGQDNIDFLNIPWGGVRNSSLDHFFISTPINDYNISPGQYGLTPIITTATTGGWVAWSNDTLGNAPALGMAHPLTTNTNDNVFRYGDAGDLSAPWNDRDFHVFEMIRFPSTGQLGFGRSMSFRYFYVLGANVDSVKNTILTNQLVSNSLDTAFIPNANDVDSVYYLFQQSGSSITTSISGSTTGLSLKTSPYLNSYPLFKITAATNEEVISSDLYFFSDDAYDGAAVDIKLLGFLDNPSRVTILNDTICTGESYVFPDSSIQINITSDVTQYSIFPSAQAGWDSLVLTNLVVTNVNVGVSQTGISLSSNITGMSYQWLDCDNLYTPISGATNQVFTAVINGNYAVEVTQNNCVDTSACYSITSVGIVENSFGNDLLIYPNPTNGNFSIDLRLVYESVTLSVTDINGKLVQSNSYNNSQLIDIKIEEPAGVYLLMVESGDKKAVISIVKE